MAFNYKDPRWQKRRLEIMERDGFQCVVCGDKESELHVHHKRYRGQPWEAEDDDMQTLCVSCHMALGKHPKAGIWYSVVPFHGNAAWSVDVCLEHCPKCGNEKFCLLEDCGLNCFSAQCDYTIPKFKLPHLPHGIFSVATPHMVIMNSCIPDPDLLSTIIHKETGE